MEEINPDKFFEKMKGEYSFYCLEDIVEFINEYVLYADYEKDANLELIKFFDTNKTALNFVVSFYHPTYITTNEYLIHNIFHSDSHNKENIVLQMQLNKIANISVYDFYSILHYRHSAFDQGRYISAKHDQLDIDKNLKDNKIQLLRMEFSLLSNGLDATLDFNPADLYSYLHLKLEYKFAIDNTLYSQNLTLIEWPK